MQPDEPPGPALRFRVLVRCVFCRSFSPSELSSGNDPKASFGLYAPLGLGDTVGVAGLGDIRAVAVFGPSQRVGRKLVVRDGRVRSAAKSSGAKWTRPSSAHMCSAL
jgi:hypothetical protein